KKNRLPDYLSRHPIEFNDPDLIDPDYDLQVKPRSSSSIISVGRRSQTVKCCPSENRYVLVITDLFSTWVTAVALPSCTAVVTAEAIFKHYNCHYGVSVTISSDNGSHIRNQLLQALEHKIGIHHIFSLAYHPRSNGMIQRFNAAFIPQIAKLLDSEYNNWDEFLDPVIFAYNTGVHSSTKFSPYELQFGRQPRLSIDPSPTQLNLPNPSDYYVQLIKSLKPYQLYSRENTIKQQNLSAIWYNKSRKDKHYIIGDYVLTRVRGNRLKLDPRFHPTPMIIIKEKHPA
ncbi:unnamed protein product, partial [Didymodactylos carnosus]